MGLSCEGGFGGGHPKTDYSFEDGILIPREKGERMWTGNRRGIGKREGPAFFTRQHGKTLKKVKGFSSIRTRRVEKERWWMVQGKGHAGEKAAPARGGGKRE